jgi:hypothetical protein
LGGVMMVAFNVVNSRLWCRAVLVVELRTVMGAEELDQKGRVRNELLSRYANFHQSALRPAVKEINEMTDVRLSYVERKRQARSA